MRWMNRLATALLVVTVVAGPPLLAGIWLHHWWQTPTRAQIEAWAEQPLTAGTIIAGCTIIAGLAWLLLLTYLTRRALTVLRRRLRRLRHLPVPTPAQMTASSMAGIAAFTLPTATADHPQPLPALPSTPHLPDPTDCSHHPDRLTRTQPAGITLPGGGWIPYRTAAVITALAAAFWLQRRRSYRPDAELPRDHARDSDLQPLPDAVDTIIAAVTDDAISAHDRTPPRPLLSQPLPPGVLLLTGPGAAAAARGILITGVLSDTAVSVRPDNLHLLLPANHPAGTPIAFIATETSKRSHAHARTIIVLDDDLAFTHRWHVTADGTATGTGLAGPHRLCTLDPRTTVDLLTFTNLQHQAELSDPPPTSAKSQSAIPTLRPAVATAAQLTLFGDWALSVAGEQVQLRRTASQQILAYLAIHPEGASRNDLTHAVWPHLPAATISQRLHTTLTGLRQQLRPLLDEHPITRHDNRYQLNTRAVSTDLQPWRNAVHAMTHAVGTAARQRACQDVVDLYHGDLAAGHAWPWLAPAREQCRRTVIDAYTTLANINPDKGIHWLQHAITIDPYNESLHHQVAHLLNASGDSVGAADVIERLRLRLAGGPH